MSKALSFSDDGPALTPQEMTDVSRAPAESRALTWLRERIQLPGPIESLRAAYQGAKPFPHVVMDNLFSAEMLNSLLPEIDGMQRDQWRNIEQDPRERTLRMHSAVEIGAAGERFLSIVHSAAFLYLLSEITGVWQLLPDPYLQGGGYAAMRRGDYFNVHSDRNVAYDTGMTRRLAMIVFLNKEWQASYHGQLELWDSDAKKCHVFIDPLFNKTVLFEVAFPNYHGVPIPLACPVDRTRQSFIVYYHTVGINGKPDVKPHTSIFAPRLHGTNRFTLRSILGDVTPPVLTRALRKLTRSS
jgi:Rps23 Pro-64 3,4-dihydroxylase Tpa1-like proline 4-hydroxylase